jgi:putative heme iron utilization protein
MSAANDVRTLLNTECGGVLCTLSSKVSGWPFGSVTPYALTPAGEPILLISELAEHTRNVRDDARASLLVQDTRALEDPQAGARATIMGYAIPVAPPFIQAARSRYLDLFPKSAEYLEVHDFSLFKLTMERVRYIGGFGEIHWIEGREVLSEDSSLDDDPIRPFAKMICTHMNEDHADSLALFARTFAGLQTDSTRMISADRQGFDMIATSKGAHKHLRLGYPYEVATRDDVRKVIVEMVRQARAKSGPPGAP